MYGIWYKELGKIFKRKNFSTMRIRIRGLQIQIGILLCSSLTFKVASKESQSCGNQVFSLLFSLVMEVSGSGSERLINMRVRKHWFLQMWFFTKKFTKIFKIILFYSGPPQTSPVNLELQTGGNVTPTSELSNSPPQSSPVNLAQTQSQDQWARSKTHS